MIRFYWLVIIFYPAVLFGQVEVTASLDSTSIITGDQIQLTIQVSYPENASLLDIDLTALENTNYLEILEEKDLDVVQNLNGNFFEKILTITSFDTGYYFLPKIPVIISIGESMDTFYSTSPALEVSLIPIKSEEAALMPIKEIRKEPIGLEDILPYLIGALCLGLIIWLISFIKKRKKKSEIPIVLDSRTPYQLAIDKLTALDVQKFIAENSIKEFHFELSFIFREYLEKTFNRPALESTLKEVIEIVKLIGLDDQKMDQFVRGLEKAEMIKFAKLQPEVSFHNNLLEEIKGIVDFVHLKEEEKKKEINQEEKEIGAEDLRKSEENTEEA